MTESAWLVVGLGNPGADYAATRHNIGFLALEVLAQRVRDKLARHKRSRALVAEGHLSGHRVVLAEPQSYMNESGGPVAGLLSFYKIEPDHLIVLHDELDLAFGTLRCKLGGGDNGHNGLKSIRRSTGTGDFYRIRLGIGRPPGRQDPADYVLKSFGSTERAEVPLLAETGADAVESILAVGLDKTQTKFNS